MKTSYLFVGLTILLIVTMLTLGLLVVTSENRVLFVVFELLAVSFCVFLVLFYMRVVRPLQVIANGMDLLKEQYFASNLKHVGQPEADRIVDIFNKMMSQLKDERLRIEEQHFFLSQFIEASPMGVVILDYDRNIVRQNPAARRFLSNETLQKELHLIPLGTSKTIRMSDASIYKCTHASFFDRGMRRSFYLVESLTEDMFKAEKEAYEKVIRMIAHEVNNSMCGITSTLDMLHDMFQDIDGMADINEVVKVSTERCYKLSEFITNFANVVKIPDIVRTTVDINGMVHNCMLLMESRCTERNIAISTELTASNPVKHIDSVLFEQVIINITKNAIESIHHDHGSIVIRTTDNTIEVINNGDIITPDIEKKLFTPFFSSKPAGQGLGLLFIREVLVRHGCQFSLRSEVELTIFRIILQS